MSEDNHVMVISGNDIATATNGLQWILDDSENYRSLNSRLIVDPVSEADNHSMYQCSVGLPGDRKINSTIATLRVSGM